jgi:hypothetical protein
MFRADLMRMSRRCPATVYTREKADSPSFFSENTCGIPLFFAINILYAYLYYLRDKSIN